MVEIDNNMIRLTTLLKEIIRLLTYVSRLHLFELQLYILLKQLKMK